AGAEHTCAIADQGKSVYCWGVTPYGQAGAPQTSCTGLNFSDRCNLGATKIPLSLDTAETVKQLVLGDGHSCARTSTRVLCWGADANGQLGQPTPSVACSDAGSDTCSMTPLVVNVIAQPATAIAAGRAHTCAILADQSAVCWGSNGNGQLGVGTATAIGPVR